METPESLTVLLNAAQAGDSGAAKKAYAAVYAELKRQARNSLRGAGSSHTLGATGLVHEIYLRLNERDGTPVRDRGHFFALAARAMRQVLVDRARRRMSKKRGGEVAVTGVDTELPLHADDPSRTLEIDAALRALEARDPELAQLVEWHFFAGLNFEEIALATDRHERTVRRDWELARAFLRRALSVPTP